MDNTVKGMIYDIQNFSVHDGPGIRTTIFEKGCPLSCKWCHSPESQSYQPQLCVFPARCIGEEKCGRCLPACAEHAISYAADPTVSIDRVKCTDCLACAEQCHSRALFISGRAYTVEEVMSLVLKQKSVFQNSGGGVTISGGECLTQPAFTCSLLRALHAHSIHTAVDTTGYVRYEILRETIPYTDLYLYDLKHMDPKMHQAGTGVSNELILENAKKLVADGAVLQIRIPIIPGYNDLKANLVKSCNFCKELMEIREGGLSIVQLLPYHKMGLVKYDRIGVRYELVDVQPPSSEDMDRIRSLFESYGIPCRIH